MVIELLWANRRIRKKSGLIEEKVRVVNLQDAPLFDEVEFGESAITFITPVL